MKARQPTWAGGRPPGTPPPTAYLHTFDEAARLLGGVSRREVDRLVDRGLLVRVILGPRNYRITDESVRALITRASNDDTGGDGKGGGDDRSKR